MNGNQKMKVSLKILRSLFIFIVIGSLFFTGGYIYGRNGYQTSIKRLPDIQITRDVPEDKDLDFSLFWRVWDTLHTKYFDQEKINDAELVYGAIGGMVAAVGDPYTVFLPPSDNKVVQEDLQGSFEGVGIQIGFKGTQLAVIAPLPSSPAEKAGIKAGDYIINIKDEARNIDMGTMGVNLQDAVQAIRGPSGSKVSLTLLREDIAEPIEVEIAREAINIPSVVIDYLGDDSSVAHIKVLKFSGETLAEWETAVVDLLKKPDVTGIVLDVRNNPGGFMQGSIELASDFLEIGDNVVVEEDYSGTKQEFRVDKIGRLKNFNLVVLINQGSASASEILAGALRDNKKTKLIGDTTFGKGTIQEPQQINGGSGLHITIARWITPSGYWVNDQGLKPDIEIEDNEETEEDEQLQEAIKIVKGL